MEISKTAVLLANEQDSERPEEMLQKFFVYIFTM